MGEAYAVRPDLRPDNDNNGEHGKAALAAERETAGTSLGCGWGKADTGRHSSSRMIGAVTRKYASPPSCLR